MIAGGDVVKTVSRDLLRPDETLSTLQFILVMIAAMLAAAMWIHLATILGAPVSTTHAIVGGVVGAGAAAFGLSVVSWPIIGAIAASWVVSPALGGMIAAARRWVPVLVALMAGVFAMYLVSKGLRRVWHAPLNQVLLFGVVFFGLAWMAANPWVQRRSRGIENRRKHIANLFTLPLVFAAALLSFAHGANDVANAVGPLAAIVAAAESGSPAGPAVALPFWILAIGAVGISLGLAMFGPRVIRTVGEQITRMDAIRAYCVALSAAITVLIASALGLPVSSTHIAVGAVFGVGFLREYLSNTGVQNPAVQPHSLFLEPSKLNRTPEAALKTYQKRERRRLVRRQHAVGIAAAWVVTVPAAGLLAALLYWLMRAMSG
jgi:PiT family inorganic phosphate transporter